MIDNKYIYGLEDYDGFYDEEYKKLNNIKINDVNISNILISKFTPKSNFNKKMIIFEYKK